MTVEATEYSSAFGTEKKPFPFRLTKNEFLKSAQSNSYRTDLNHEYSSALGKWIGGYCWIIKTVKVHHLFFSDGSEYELRLGVYELIDAKDRPTFKFINV